MKPRIKELTKAEEQIMQILWSLEQGYIKEIVEQFPEPKPAYNTVSTFVRILVKKGVVGYKSLGNTHQYFPIVSKQEYTKTYLTHFVGNYFNHSYKKLVSFFTNEEQLSIQDLEEMKQFIDQEIKRQKQDD